MQHNEIDSKIMSWADNNSIHSNKKIAIIKFKRYQIKLRILKFLKSLSYKHKQ